MSKQNFNKSNGPAKRRPSSSPSKDKRSDSSRSDKPRFSKDAKPSEGRKSFGRKDDSRSEKPFGRSTSSDTRTNKGSKYNSDSNSRFSKSTDRREGGAFSNDRKKSYSSSEERPYARKRSADSGEFKKPYDKTKTRGDKPFGKSSGGDFKKPFNKDKTTRSEKPYGRGFSDDRPFKKSFPTSGDSERPRFKKDSNEFESSGEGFEKPIPSYKRNKFDGDKVRNKRKAYENKLDNYGKKKFVAKEAPLSDEIRLNKYISNSGICSRREADDLIAQGLIKVNGEVITELGYKVKTTDSIKYNDKVIKPEKLVYVLLNKPKDFITTMDDEGGRKTVMDLVATATRERIFPVGRLDRNTTGLLLLTNDGELTQKLTHPSFKIKKIYEVEIDKPITTEDFEKLQTSKIHLFDGPVKIDDVAIISPGKKILGIEIHEGRNRIVRRVFESMGYEVVKLDRVMYAGLTKKDLPRSKWRFLSTSEVNMLKYML
jgi:23S rRNA pseudouridine2605 synthase